MLQRSCYILFFFIAVKFVSSLKKPPVYIQEATTEGFSIVGGEAADIKDVPYQVSLLIDQYFECGGSIIAPDIILTAAHCVVVPPSPDNSSTLFQIRAGSTLTNQGGSLVNVTKIRAHPGFSFSTADNDVALMWLADKLEFGDTIKVVELAKSGEELPPGTDVLVSGWGDQRLLRQMSQDILQKLTLPTIDTEICKKIYKEYPADIYQVTDNMMCAGVEGRNACHGDSGGPLVQNNAQTQVQYGIVSWGAFCANNTYPNVYTKVAAVRNWIDNTVKEEN